MMVVIVIMMTMMPWMTDNDDGGKCDSVTPMQAMPDPAGQKNMKRKGSPVKIQVDLNCL